MIAHTIIMITAAAILIEVTLIDKSLATRADAGASSARRTSPRSERPIGPSHGTSAPPLVHSLAIRRARERATEEAPRDGVLAGAGSTMSSAAHSSALARIIEHGFAVALGK